MQDPFISANSEPLGIDIGGANLKYADAHGNAHSIEFPLWLRPHDLTAQIYADLDRYPATTQISVTMTGELADCFLNRAVGVQHIVDHVCAAASKLGLREPLFYGVDGLFHDSQSARETVDIIAAANWHALANFASQYFAPQLQRGGLLADIGSTTTDLIPLSCRRITTASRTDYERLREGSLVYLGGGRTPICSLVDHLTIDGQDVPVMREVFATMDDARLLLGFTAVDASDCRTADGKPRDVFHAANRIARMIGLDHRTIDINRATELARQIHRRGQAVLADAIQSIPWNGTLIVSGHCDDLLSIDRNDCETISMQSVFGDVISRCAPAYAVAMLAGAAFENKISAGRSI